MLRSRRSHVVLDVVLALWAAVWITVGLSVASEVRGLTRLSDPAQTIEEAGRSAVVSARQSRDSAGRVAVLLGISVVLIPTLPTHSLLHVSEAPGADFADGRHAALADAELARLGLRRPERLRVPARPR